ncbi:MAG TPA: hypothetical protein VFL94_12565 [Actinomycetales bacterium]|nr:hypothetical protein [Actinomycetales bacterium]
MEPSTIDLSDAALMKRLQEAYTARLEALVDGDDRALAATGREVEDLECRLLEHRQLRELATASFTDTAYYLG